ncbi:ABC1 kinase family protein [Streptomyces sp. NPDC001443]
MLAETILVSLGIVLAAAWILRRFMGFDRGRWVTTVFAVVIGQGATIGILQVVAGDVGTLPWSWVPVGLAMVACLSMLAYTLMQMLLPVGRRPPTALLLHPLAASRRFGARTARHVEVLWYALRSGLLRGGPDDPGTLGSRLGRALATTFEDAGGLFVKLGQAMAAQPQLVTPRVAAQMSRLNEQAAPSDPDAVRRAIEDELGDPSRVFARFDAEPAAAASIAQTHFATLHDGREVIVKVRRPGIRASVERDLDILRRLVERLDRRTTWAKSLGLAELTAGFAEATEAELDFRFEAANVLAARAALREHDPITVPEIMEEYTTARILVEERVPGRSISTPGILDGLEGGQRSSLADALLGLLVRQMAEGERFHADPHPGNVFFRPDGRLALIDFGAVGRLNRFERGGLIDLLRGLQAEDPSLLRQAALHIGTQTARVDGDALERELAGLLARATLPDGRLNSAIFSEFVMVFRDFGIVLPRSTTTLFRTLVTLVGTLELIDPGYELVAGIRRVGGEVAARQMLPSSVTEFVQQELLTTAPVLKRLPKDLDDLARSLVRGEIRTRVSLLSEPEDFRAVRCLVNRSLMAVIGTGMGVASSLLLTVPQSSGGIGLVSVLGGIGLAFSVLMMLRVLTQILREQE